MTVTDTHAATVIHTVANWLEKIYVEDPRLQIAELSQQEAKSYTDFEHKDNQRIERQYGSLRALFQMLRAGRTQEAMLELTKKNQFEL